MRALAMMLAAVTITPASVAGQATIGGEWRSAARTASQQIIEAGLSPGVGVAVAVGDWVAWSDGYGSSHLSAGRGVTGDTPFYIASTSKALTGLAVVLAAAEGRIDLQAPMVRYLPDARLPEGVPRESITVHDLIALTHGLAGFGPVVLRTAYTGEFTREQLLDLLRYHAPTGEHGTFDYNNLGYNLAGMVLEAVYDEPWQDVVDRLVVGPIGMRSTAARLSELDLESIAWPHQFTPSGWSVTPIGKDDANMHAAGGHFASARDLARYLAAHMGGGIVEGTRVLPDGPVRETHVQRVTQNRSFGPFRRHGWAYGWDLGTYGTDTLMHRFGSFGGYRSHMSFMPQHDLGVVVLVNGDGPASDAADLLATYLYELLLAKPGAQERFAAQLDSMKSRLPAARQSIATHLAERAARLAPLPHPLEDYAGTYVSPVLGTMVWRVVAGGLELRMGVVESRAEVYDAAQNALRIEIGGGGQVAQFVFGDGAGPARAVRLAGQEFTRLQPSN